MLILILVLQLSMFYEQDTIFFLHFSIDACD